MSFFYTAETARRLADPTCLPGEAPTYDWSFTSVKRLQFDTMLVNASVMTHDREDIRVQAYGECSGLSAELRKGVLHLSAPLPFKLGKTQRPLQLLRRWLELEASMTTLTSGSSSSRHFRVNGREIDLRQALQLVIWMPALTPMTVARPYGAIGIGCQMGNLHVVSSMELAVFATQVHRLTGAIGASSSVEVGGVTGGVELETNLSSKLTTGDVAGNVKLELGSSTQAALGQIGGDLRLTSGLGGNVKAQSVAGDIHVEGTSTKVAIASGVSGKLSADLSIDCKLTHAGRVTEISHLDLSPGATAVINGQRYTWSPFGNDNAPRAPRPPRPPRPPRMPW